MANESVQYNPPNFEEYKQSFTENGFQPHEDGEPLSSEEGQGGSDPTTDGVEVQPPRKKKNANPFNKRIDRLTAEKGEFEQHAHFLAQQLAERDAVIAAQREKEQELLVELSHKSKYADSAFEHNLQNLENSLIDKIEQAELEGDIRKKTELGRDLAKVVAQQSTYELYKSQQQQQQQQALYNEPYIPYETPIITPLPPRQAPVNEDFMEWRESNSWYGEDANLTREADEIAEDLARRLRFNNQAQLIGTNEFRQSISNIMHDRYGIGAVEPEAQEDSSSYAPTYQTRPPAVAPVQRRGTSMADQYVTNRGNGNQRMSPLTKEEYNLARYLPQKHKTESESDLIARYARGKNYPKSPLPGGTPHRLTIL